ncbi:unnamed protein product, partial [Ectocarpus sp. 6 AP-2014]
LNARQRGTAQGILNDETAAATRINIPSYNRPPHEVRRHTCGGPWGGFRGDRIYTGSHFDGAWRIVHLVPEQRETCRRGDGLCACVCQPSRRRSYEFRQIIMVACWQVGDQADGNMLFGCLAFGQILH